MVIREIKKNEMNKLLELYTHLHRKDAPLPEESKLLSIWEEITTNPRLYYFVLEHDNELISSCTLSIIPNLTRGGRPYGLIENVVTHANYRRRGFGSSILKYALEVAWKNQCFCPHRVEDDLRTCSNAHLLGCNKKAREGSPNVQNVCQVANTHWNHHVRYSLHYPICCPSAHDHDQPSDPPEFPSVFRDLDK